MQQKDLFFLKEGITFLNHGSFGACPKPVFEDWQKWQMELEREPVQFFVHRGMEVMQTSKMHLAKFIGCSSEDLVFTPNPTYAINIVAKSLKLERGDEVLASSHEYGAMDRTWNYYCEKAGAKYINQSISLPIVSEDMMFEEFWKGYSKNTKVVFINHISSATALIFPVKRIIERAKELGLMTIIDGAHVPGHLHLDISDLDPDIYTGANHKWLLTPKGNSFLYVRKELQRLFDPLLISWGYKSMAPGPNRFHDYHELQGTRDYTSFLTIPAALNFIEDHSWNEVVVSCKMEILRHYKSLCDVVGTNPICPINNRFLGQMASIPVRTKDPLMLKSLLYKEYQIEIPVFSWQDYVFVRISLNGYNDESDIHTLAEAMSDLVARGEILVG
ncbi:MAG: aminotransferase class V-fold PLP-dependent enzyme [Flavobacteriales bacterium]|nr:aminotransferase class V-fold PLP-dependent enzyme [Flavobacteriales bacterium]